MAGNQPVMSRGRMAHRAGLEPATVALTVRCSTIELPVNVPVSPVRHAYNEGVLNGRIRCHSGPTRNRTEISWASTKRLLFQTSSRPMTELTHWPRYRSASPPLGATTSCCPLPVSSLGAQDVSITCTRLLRITASSATSSPITVDAGGVEPPFPPYQSSVVTVGPRIVGG